VDSSENLYEGIYWKLPIIVFGLLAPLVVYLVYIGRLAPTFEARLQTISLAVNAVLTTVLIALYYWMAHLQHQVGDIQEQQVDIMELQYSPRLAIRHEEVSDSDEERSVTYEKESIVFENIGEVPIEGVVRLSLASFDNTDSDSVILDEDTPYDELPEKVKIHGGSAGDWREYGLFLDPSENTKIDFQLVQGELKGREEEYPEGEFFWLRCDAEFHSTIGDKTRQIQRLFRIWSSEKGTVFTSEPFWWARKKASEE